MLLQLEEWPKCMYTQVHYMYVQLCNSYLVEELKRQTMSLHGSTGRLPPGLLINKFILGTDRFSARMMFLSI